MAEFAVALVPSCSIGARDQFRWPAQVKPLLAKVWEAAALVYHPDL